MELPRLEVPVVGAPMAGGPSTPELVAAVSEAGGLGTAAAGYLAPERLAADLARVHELTDRPFGVNLFAPMSAVSSGEQSADAVDAYRARLASLAGELGVEPGAPRFDDDAFDAKLDVAIAARPALLSFTFGVGSPGAVDRAHAAGVPVAITVTDPAQVTDALDAGADALILQGWEAGGHRGGLVEDDAGNGGEELGLATLLDRVASMTDVPLLAAGGIADGRAIRAVLDAGAWAAVIGSALLRTTEAGTSEPHRAALTEGRATVVSRAFTGRSARGLDNAFTRTYGEHAPRAYPQVHHLTSPLRAAARARGDAENINLWAGVAASSAQERPVGELISEWRTSARASTPER